MGVLDWLYSGTAKSTDKLKTGSAEKSVSRTKQNQKITKKRADCAMKQKEYDPVTDKCV